MSSGINTLNEIQLQRFVAGAKSYNKPSQYAAYLLGFAGFLPAKNNTLHGENPFISGEFLELKMKTKKANNSAVHTVLYRSISRVEIWNTWIHVQYSTGFNQRGSHKEAKSKS